MTKSSLKYLSLLPALSVSSLALAAEHEGGAPAIVSFYEPLLAAFGVHGAEAMETWKPVVGSLLTLVLTIIIGLLYKRKVEASKGDVVPTGKFDFRGVVEMIMEFIHDLAINVIGEDSVRPFLSALFGLFLFIFVSNMTGLIPGLTPATEGFSTNLVLGLFSFLVFNYAGIREHGIFGYLKTFAGPLIVMAPFIFGIEFLGMLVRPVSLALRLTGNIFGDHLVLSVFTGLTKVVLPSALLFFGLLVACLQSFVFTLLSGIYVSIAISHDH